MRSISSLSLHVTLYHIISYHGLGHGAEQVQGVEYKRRVRAPWLDFGWRLQNRKPEFAGTSNSSMVQQ